MPRGHGAAGERHPARDRRVQELPRQRQGLARGGASTPPLPAPGAADADAERLLRGGGRGRVPLRHGALPRREQGRHRAAPRHLGPLAEPLPGPATAGGTSPEADDPDDPLEVPVQGPAAPEAVRTCSTSSSTSSCSRRRRARRSRRSRATSSSRRSTTSWIARWRSIGKPVERAGSHRPHLAHAGLGQVADHDLRRPTSCGGIRR